MDTTRILRGPLSILLTAALVLSAGLPAGASEIPEETVPATLPEETVWETTEAALPPPAEEETTAPTEQTQPTVPEETQPPETVPPETMPEETAPPTQQPQVVPVFVTVDYAKAMPAGTQALTLKGTVVFSAYGKTVLQDTTGGICLTFAQGETPAVGRVLRVTGARTETGLAVEQWEEKGFADLPAQEAAIGSISPCTRVLLKQVSYQDGFLLQDMARIPMTPANPEGIANGDLVNVLGVAVDGCLYADTIEKVSLQPKPLPQVSAMPAAGTLLPGEQIILQSSISGCTLYYAISYDGATYSSFIPYTGPISPESSAPVVYLLAYGVTAEGEKGSQSEFRFTVTPVQTPDTDPEPDTDTGTTVPGDGRKLFFGQLHAHTDLSDGLGTVEEAFAYAARVEGLDFFAVTDHSNSFDNADAGAIGTDGSTISQAWARGKAAAAAVTNPGFVGIFGYEISWQEIDRLGHINTFGTPGWQSSTQPSFSSLEQYYQALTTVPGSVSQFNHPGTVYGSFDNFGSYHPKYDSVIHLLEVGSENGFQAYDAYTRALDAGWHVAPSNNQANHSKQWGDASDVRTVVLADALTEEALLAAIRSYRVYATEDRNLEIRYRLDGAEMGSVLKAPATNVTASLRDPSGEAIGLVEVVTEGGVTAARQQVNEASAELTLTVPGTHTYYYLRITQPDGDVAVTAPVWIDLYVDAGIRSFSASAEKPVQGQEVTLTLELYNNESTALSLEKLEFSMNGQLLHRAENPSSIPALDSLRYSFPLHCDGLGLTEIRASAVGTVDGVRQSFETTLQLWYQSMQTDLAVSSIAYARGCSEGQVVKVKGYVTAGTSNPFTTFPGMLYLQDDTGGIAVTDFLDAGIQLGTPLEICGKVTKQDGNPTLQLLQYQVLGDAYYRCTPKVVTNRQAMDAAYGAQLLQVEGQVISLIRTADGRGISRFSLLDSQGDVAVVRIDDAILSGSYGVNQLTAQVVAGRQVRAVGIAHREADGTAVLRVRNCDEVVSVAAAALQGSASTADPSNPKTGWEAAYKAPLGDGISTPLLVAVMGICAAGLAALMQMKRKTK